MYNIQKNIKAFILSSMAVLFLSSCNTAIGNHNDVMVQKKKSSYIFTQEEFDKYYKDKPARQWPKSGEFPITDEDGYHPEREFYPDYYDI